MTMILKSKPDGKMSTLTKIELQALRADLRDIGCPNGADHYLSRTNSKICCETCKVFWTGHDWN